jgi:hypothetical protein
MEWNGDSCWYKFVPGVVAIARQLSLVWLMPVLMMPLLLSLSSRRSVRSTVVPHALQQSKYIAKIVTLSIFPCVDLLIHPSVRTSIHPSIHPSIFIVSIIPSMHSIPLLRKRHAGSLVPTYNMAFAKEKEINGGSSPSTSFFSGYTNVNFQSPTFFTMQIHVFPSDSLSCITVYKPP